MISQERHMAASYTAAMVGCAGRENSIAVLDSPAGPRASQSDPVVEAAIDLVT